LKLVIFKNLRHLHYLLLLTLSINCTNTNIAIDEKENYSLNKDVLILVKNSKNKKLSPEYRKSNLYKAYNFNANQKNDSIKNNALLKISYQAYKLNDSLFFLKTNKEAYKLSLKLKDNFSIADTYWNNGLFFFKNEVLDSAYIYYYKSFNIYNSLKNQKNSGIMLYNIALTQSRLKSFTNSETNIFKAITIFKELKNHKLLYQCYNHLGNIHQELKNFKKSIEFHEKALINLSQLKNKKTYTEGVYNNIALTYQIQGKYTEAIFNFKKALKNDSLYFKNIKRYARLKDNLAYTRLLSGDTLGVENELLATLKIRDSLNNISGVAINSLHLAEYYLMVKDTIKAFSYAKNAYKLANSVNNNRDILASLSLLSILDKENSNYYFKAYQKLTDELQLKERNLRNKFARIRFETDEHIEEANKQSSEKIMAIAIGSSIIIILSLLYYARHQRGKNRELKLETEQQNANEKVYSLLLKQQSKLEEGRVNERHRISQELHDGVLGKIFATRMRLDFLDIEGADETQQKYQLYLGELQGIEKEIRVISHELKNELLNDKSDFTQIIEHLVAEQSGVLNFMHQIEEDDTVHWSMITNNIKINCYRITQEALQNINKHSKATNVSILFSSKNNILSLNIKDDGIGFDTKKQNPGIGLQNISDRVKNLNGTFVVTSSLGQGSLLCIHIPITVLDTNLT